MLLKLVLITWVIPSSFAESQNIAKITEDFMKLQKSSIAITSFLCRDKVKLMKLLGNRFFINSIDTIPLLKSPERPHLFILDMKCDNALKILRSARDLGYFNSLFKWFIFGNPPKDMIFDLDSKVFIVQPDSKIVARYKLPFEVSSRQNFVGRLTDDTIIDYHELNIARNRTDLMGSLVTISYVVTNLDTLNHFWDYRNLHIDALSKHSYILVHHLMDYLNASKKFILRDTWGYKNKTTGSYSGMSGDLHSKTADLGGTAMFILPDRLEFIDYIASPNPTFIRFIFKAPPLSYVTNVYTLPFDVRVWHYAFVMVAVIVFCVYLIVKWEWYDDWFRLTIDNSALRPKFFDVVMLQIGAISQQGTAVEPKSNSGRIATFFMFAMLMFMYTSYSANIVALLQSTTNNIKTLRDLYDSGMRLGAQDLVYQRYFYKSETAPITRLIYDQRIAPKGQVSNFMSAEDGMKNVQKGFFAFNIELTAGYQFVSELFHEHEKCQLREMVFLTFNPPYLGIPKKSPYSKIFKVGMRKLQESGIQKREFNRLHIKKPTCTGQGRNFQSVGLVDCYSAFVLFAFGVTLAICLMLLEIAHKIYLNTSR